tara:strand:- start:73 stop:240 length:168 start_codon:yes stop_codon:yes gene_type:complete
MFEVFIWGIVVIGVIAYLKYLSEHWEKAKNQFTYINPLMKKPTFWERIRRLFKDN